MKLKLTSNIVSIRLSIKVLAILGVILIFQSVQLLPKYDGKIDPEIQPYVTVVKNLSKGNLVPNAGIGFGHTGKTSLARCFTWTSEITVDKESWKGLSYQQRVALIAHEIGHCACDKRHIDTEENGCYTSFMSSKDTGVPCTRIMFDRYVKEMQEMDCGN